VDVYEGESAVTILVELAGVNEEELEVLLFEDALVIDGRRNLPVAEEVVYHAAGIRQGPFRVEVPLPTAVNADKVDASYERGLLRVRVPKSDGGRSNG
jgi:HSP20 family protein